MDDSFIYRYRPRVSGEQSAYSWYPHAPRKPREKEFEHQGSITERISTQRSDFIVSPEWVSEEIKRDTIVPFRGRRWRPCPWEFHGARHWPYMNMENKLEEERQIKALLTSREVPQERLPVVGTERQELGPPMRMRLIPQKTPWRPKTGCWNGYVVNNEAGVYGNPSRPLARPQSVHFSRHLNNIEDYKFSPGFEEYYDDESPYHFHHPDDVAETGGSHIKTRRNITITPTERENAFLLHPNIATNERPRFDRPYINSANAMWIGVKYTSSPGQN